MKNVIALSISLLTIANIAKADFVPGRVRPHMRAKLVQVDQDGPQFPLAKTLSLNFQDGHSKPVSFTLVEDTGIRCVSAPCPSQATTTFKITNISHSFHNDNVIRYEAIQVLKNIPPHVRIAPRRLFVTESSMELVAPGGNGFSHRTVWDVELKQINSAPQMYQGFPQHLMVTM